MDTDIRPALRRLVHALRHGADVSALMLRILDEAEQAAARIDWSGGGDGKASAPKATDTPAFTGVGAPGLAFTSVGAVLAAIQAAAAEQAQSRGGGGARASRASLQGSLDGQTVPPNPEDVPDTAAGRSEEYRRWSAWLRRLPAPINDIRFFDAAAHVTSLLGLAEGGVPLNALATMQVFGTLNGAAPDFAGAKDFLERVGQRLYIINQRVFDRLRVGMLERDGSLISPLDGVTVVESALMFDIHMVVLEQRTVSRIVAAEVPTDEQIAAINFLLNAQENVRSSEGIIDSSTTGILLPFMVNVLSGDTRFVNWAASAVHAPGAIDFANEDHRIAMGVARVFQEHGLSFAEYLVYMDRVSTMGPNDLPPSPDQAPPAISPPSVASPQSAE